MCRTRFNAAYTVPQWSGWLSLTTAVACAEKSVVGYMPPIIHPITEYQTVQHCLLTSMEVSKKLDHMYTFVTMDLAAANIAYDIMRHNPETSYT